MKILQMVHDFPPQSYAGTELYTLSLARALRRRGHDVTVLYPVTDPRSAPYTFREGTYQDVPVVRCSVPRRETMHDPALHAPFGEFLDGRGFDVLHVQHLLGLSGGCMAVARERGVRVALKVDDMFFYCARGHLMDADGRSCTGPETEGKCERCTGAPQGERASYLRGVFATADMVHTPSRFLRGEHRGHGFHSARFHVVPTGIEPYPRAPRRPWPGGPRIGYAGMLAWRKGFADFVEAAELHLASRPATRARFVVHGEEEDGGPLPLLRARMDALPLEYRGPFRPADRGRLFAELDLLVVPSRGDHYPFVIREALYAGLPVVATRVGAVPEIVRHGENGLLVEPGGTASLAEIFGRVEDSPDLLLALRPDPSAVRLIDSEAAELLELFGGLLDD